MELAMAKGAIAHFDTNKDGKVSLKEYMDAQGDAFRTIDANKDKAVTPEEMVAFQQKKREEMQARFAEQAKPAPAGKQGPAPKDGPKPPAGAPADAPKAPADAPKAPADAPAK